MSKSPADKKNGDAATAPAKPSSRTIATKRQSSMRICVKMQMEEEFGKEYARISQLAAGALGDMFIVLIKNIIRKAIALLKLGNLKTIMAKYIIAAAKSMMSSPSVEAQKAWWQILSAGNQMGTRRMDSWANLKSTLDQARRGEDDKVVKARVDEVFQAAPFHMFIRPTLMQHFIKECIPPGWRVSGYQPAIALSAVLAQICTILANSIRDNDVGAKNTVDKGKRFLMAPKHVLRGIKSDMILSRILGCSTLSVVNAPIGLMETYSTKKRRRSHKKDDESYESDESYDDEGYPVDVMPDGPISGGESSESESESESESSPRSGKRASPPSPSLPSPKQKKSRKSRKARNARKPHKARKARVVRKSR